MGIRVRVTIDGVEQTIANIDRHNVKARADLEAAVSRHSKELAKNARRNAPRKKGVLRKAISTKYYKSRTLAVTAPNHRKAPHRAFFVNGTKPRYNKKGAFRGKVDAVRYMEPAAAQQKPKFERELKQIFLKEEEV